MWRALLSLKNYFDLATLCCSCMKENLNISYFYTLLCSDKSWPSKKARKQTKAQWLSYPSQKPWKLITSCGFDFLNMSARLAAGSGVCDVRAQRIMMGMLWGGREPQQTGRGFTLYSAVAVKSNQTQLLWEKCSSNVKSTQSFLFLCKSLPYFTSLGTDIYSVLKKWKVLALYWTCRGYKQYLRSTSKG